MLDVFIFTDIEISFTGREKAFVINLLCKHD